MNWTKPVRFTDSADFYLDGENGYRICKAITPRGTVYTLSHRGELVVSSLDLEVCKGRADENRD